VGERGGRAPAHPLVLALGLGPAPAAQAYAQHVRQFDVRGGGLMRPPALSGGNMQS
jgi:ABC-type uncharacterized transport system ATPase subunit